MNTNNGKAPEAFTGAATRLQFLGYINRKAKAYAIHPGFLPPGKRNAYLRNVADTAKSIITPEVWDEMKDNPQAQDLRAKITMAWSQDYFQGVPSDIIEKRYEIHLARVYAMLYGAEQSEIECLDHITYCAAFAVEHCAKQHPRITPHEKAAVEVVATEFLCDLLAPDIWEAIKDDADAKSELAYLAISVAILGIEGEDDEPNYQEDFPALSKYVTWELRE